jgi:hypothetical protein
MITEDHVIQALEDESKVFKTLMSSAVSRSFPQESSRFFSLEAVETLRIVLEDGYIPFNELSKGITDCYQMGWIHRSLLADGTRQDSIYHDIGILPSRLHEKYI